MNDFFEFLKFLEEEKITDFTFKSLSEMISNEKSISKSKVVFYCRMMREFDLIKKVTVGGGCKTVCSSCYEYGCTEPIPPPVNYWTVISYELLLIS